MSLTKTVISSVLSSRGFYILQAVVVLHFSWKLTVQIDILSTVQMMDVVYSQTEVTGVSIVVTAALIVVFAKILLVG